jgi:hypothetical protein
MGLLVVAKARNFPTASSGREFPTLPWFGDQLWLCGWIQHSALLGVRDSLTEYCLTELLQGKAKKLQYK